MTAQDAEDLATELEQQKLHVSPREPGLGFCVGECALCFRNFRCVWERWSVVVSPCSVADFSLFPLLLLLGLDSVAGSRVSLFRVRVWLGAQNFAFLRRNVHD